MDLYEECYALIRDTVQSWLLDESDWYHEAEEPYEWSIDTMQEVIEDITRHIGN